MAYFNRSECQIKTNEGQSCPSLCLSRVRLAAAGGGWSSACERSPTAGVKGGVILRDKKGSLIVSCVEFFFCGLSPSCALLSFVLLLLLLTLLPLVASVRVSWSHHSLIRGWSHVLVWPLTPFLLGLLQSISGGFHLHRCPPREVFGRFIWTVFFLSSLRHTVKAHE